jgi:acyltransferase
MSSVLNIQYNLSKSSERLNYIDIAKGIAIILVVFGHTYRNDDSLKIAIYAFHLPLFFFISGFFFKEDKYHTYRDFIKSKFTSLLLPYLTFYILSYVYWLAFERFVRPSDAEIPFYKPLIGLILGTDYKDLMRPNGALWFLVGLFCTELIFFSIVKEVKKYVYIFLIVTTIVVIGFILSEFPNLILPFSIKSAFVALGFYGIGNTFRKTKFLPEKMTNKILLMIILFVICYYFSSLNGIIDMDYSKYNNYFLFLISSVSGLFACLFMSNLIHTNVTLEYFGRNSLIIMGVSEPLKRFCIGLIAKLSDSPIEDLRNSFIFSVIIVVVVLIIMFPIIYIFNKYLSLFLGRRIKHI